MRRIGKINEIMQRMKDMTEAKYCQYFQKSDLKGFIADIHGGVVLKQLNYPMGSVLPILIRSVDRIVNDH